MFPSRVQVPPARLTCHPCADQRSRTSPRRTLHETMLGRDRARPCKGASRPPWNKSFGPGEFYQVCEPPRFCPRHCFSERRDPVIPPPLVVQLGGRTLPGFYDQTLLEHALDRPVQSPGAEFQLAARASRHVLDNCVSVPVFICKRHENVEGCRRQRKERRRIFAADSHRAIIAIVDILSMAIEEEIRSDRLC